MTRKILFRNDDVNPNSDFKAIRKMYDTILQYFPNAEIYSCVNLFSQETSEGNVYPPTKKLAKDRDYFLVNKMFDFKSLKYLERIVSHGMWHLDHKHCNNELQKYSIVSSCRILKTNLFVPPFWRYNQDTRDICSEYGIKLWVDTTWINFDNLDIIPEKRYYLFHSWKFTPESFAKKMKENIKTLKKNENTKI